MNGPTWADRKLTPSPAGVLTSAYTMWMESCARKNGTCASRIEVYCNAQADLLLGPVPYPFFNDMTPRQRAAFYGVAAMVVIVLFHTANGIHFAVDRLLGRNVTRAKLQAKGKRA